MDFFTTSGFIPKLRLNLREQTAFAIIFSFSQNGEGSWHGSLATLCEWLGNCTKPTAISALNALIDKGLIRKAEFIQNGVKRCAYSTSAEGILKYCETIGLDSKEILPGWLKNFTGGGKEILPNNKDIYINNNKGAGRKKGTYPPSTTNTRKTLQDLMKEYGC